MADEDDGEAGGAAGVGGNAFNARTAFVLDLIADEVAIEDLGHMFNLADVWSGVSVERNKSVCPLFRGLGRGRGIPGRSRKSWRGVGRGCVGFGRDR